MMIIRNSERPWLFSGKYCKQLGFNYQFNRKAWINKVLFFARLCRLEN